MAKLARKPTRTDMTHTRPDTRNGWPEPNPAKALFRSQALIDIGDCLLFGVKENERKTDPAIDAEKTDVARVGSFSDGSSEHR